MPFYQRRLKRVEAGLRFLVEARLLVDSRSAPLLTRNLFRTKTAVAEGRSPWLGAALVALVKIVAPKAYFCDFSVCPIYGTLTESDINSAGIWLTRPSPTDNKL